MAGMDLTYSPVFIAWSSRKKPDIAGAELDVIMSALKYCFLILLLSAVASVSIFAQPAKRLFEIPAYPGTVPFNDNPNMNRLQPPFATWWLVYRTSNGSPLDKEKIVAFYRRYLESKDGRTIFSNVEGTRGIWDCAWTCMKV